MIEIDRDSTSGCIRLLEEIVRIDRQFEHHTFEQMLAICYAISILKALIAEEVNEAN